MMNHFSSVLRAVNHEPSSSLLEPTLGDSSGCGQISPPLTVINDNLDGSYNESYQPPAAESTRATCFRHPFIARNRPQQHLQHQHQHRPQPSPSQHFPSKVPTNPQDEPDNAHLPLQEPPNDHVPYGTSVHPVYQEHLQQVVSRLLAPKQDQVRISQIAFYLNHLAYFFSKVRSH